MSILGKERRKARSEPSNNGRHAGPPPAPEAPPLTAADVAAPAPDVGAEAPSFALTVTPCSQLRDVPSDQLWIVPGLLARGEVTQFSALWKAGKTTFLAHQIKALEKGGEFCGRVCGPARVLYVAEERQGKWAKRRDKLVLGDHVSFVVRPFVRKPKWPEWYAFLRALKEEQGRANYDLIVLDTISNFWPVRDENDAPQLQEALMPLHDVIGPAALELVHHLRKSDGAEGTAGRGSGAFGAFVDTIIELRRHSPKDRQDRRRVLSCYGRDDETPAELVVRLTDGGYVVEGDRHEAAVNEIGAALDRLLPVAAPGLNHDEIVAAWPGQAAPREERLRDALAAGVASGRYGRDGTGRRGSPYTWWARGAADSFAFPLPYKGGKANESAGASPGPGAGPVPDTGYGGEDPFPDED